MTQRQHVLPPRRSKRIQLACTWASHFFSAHTLTAATGHPSARRRALQATRRARSYSHSPPPAQLARRQSRAARTPNGTRMLHMGRYLGAARPRNQKKAGAARRHRFTTARQARWGPCACACAATPCPTRQGRRWRVRRSPSALAQATCDAKRCEHAMRVPPSHIRTPEPRRPPGGPRRTPSRRAGSATPPRSALSMLARGASACLSARAPCASLPRPHTQSSAPHDA